MNSEETEAKISENIEVQENTVVQESPEITESDAKPKITAIQDSIELPENEGLKKNSILPEGAAPQESTPISQHPAVPETANVTESEKTKESTDKEQLIKGLIVTLQDFAGKKKFSDFWIYVKEINQVINTTLSLSKEFRAAIREQIGQICEDVKEKQAEFKEKMAINSAIKRHTIDTMIEEAMAFPVDNDGLRKSMDKLDAVLQMLKEGADNEEEAMTREDKDFCWEKWKDARTDLNLRRAEIKNANFLKIKEEIEPIYEVAHHGDPYRSKDSIKELRTRMKGLLFDDWQYEEINAALTECWETSMNRIGSIKDEKEQKHLKWRADMENKILYFQNLIEKSHGYIGRMEAQIQDLQEKLANPKTVSVHDKIEGWIEEKRQSIREAQENNENINQKILEIKNRLEEK